MQKTLGGERLGSGNKMKVDMHGYERSTHNLNTIWRSTMSAGTLVPFLSEVALMGDTWDIDLNVDGKTLPTIGPLFGGFKYQLDIFVAPMRLYQGRLHNNELNVGLKMQTVKLPVMKLEAPLLDAAASPVGNNIDNAQVNPSCILKYLGLSGIGLRNPNIVPPTDGTREFNAIPLLAYWDIYKNYYANKVEERGFVVHTGAPELTKQVDNIKVRAPWFTGDILLEAEPLESPVLVGAEAIVVINLTGAQELRDIYLQGYGGQQILASEAGEIVLATPTTWELKWDFGRYGALTLKNWRYRNQFDNIDGEIDIVEFPLENLDIMRNKIIQHTSADAFEVLNQGLYPYDYLGEKTFDVENILGNQEGLGIKCYQSDLFNNWINTEWIDGVDGISAVTSVDTSGGSFTVDSLILAKKVYDMLNRVAVSGGSYFDWLETVYDQEAYRMASTPMYMGGMIQDLVFQEVVSNSEANGNTGQPLGTLAGKGVMARDRKGGHVTIKVSEPSYIIGIVSLTPRIDYSQGNKWDLHLKTVDDLHKPAMDQIGFQDLVTEQMAWWDTWETLGNVWVQKSAGKQPAWLNYMTNVNRVFGNFCIKNNNGYMILNRNYDAKPAATNWWTIGDLTTYIDPRKYNQIFAQTSLDSQNFWTQIAVNITARRKMSAKLMQNL
jgi:hypothetical protein